MGRVRGASSAGAPKVVVLGMMSQMPVAGVVWQTLHYLLGFERLGYEAHYVETHARTPSMLMRREDDDSSALAASFVDRTLRRFDLGHRWAFRALHDDGRCLGMSERELERLYGSAELLIDLHGGTLPLPELAVTDRLIYLETDPVELQVELHRGERAAIEFLEPHSAFFTFAENLGNPDCRLPAPERFRFRPTRQPVVLDLWNDRSAHPSGRFTTVGNWRQRWRDVNLDGEIYTWSKHHEFLKFVDLPRRTRQELELALSSIEAGERRLLESKGWRVREALAFSTDLDAYRDYIAASRAEFTVAKDQNVRLRTGWFSDRSATYLAAGRPVVTQETGFSNVLPTGNGLLSYSSSDEAVEAIEAVNSGYSAHCAAAAEIAHEFFSHDVVLERLLEGIGVELSRRRPRGGGEGAGPFPVDMSLTVVSRRPINLPEPTVRAVLSRPIPVSYPSSLGPGGAGIVVVSYNNLVFTRLCLESLLANTRDPGHELIVVDNGSRDGTPEYLAALEGCNSHVRVLLNGENLGFAAASNQGLALARADHLVLLNNDTLLPPGWLAGLLWHLRDPAVGLVGPVTNRIGNEAEVEADYRTWAEFLRFSAQRGRERRGRAIDIRVPAMFCVAMRRDVYERLGPLDERYEIGLLEDDDYAMRARSAGYRLRCAEDVFVHHFGEASFGKLVPTGEQDALLRANKARYAEKWGEPWQPYRRRHGNGYRGLRDRVRLLIEKEVPPLSTVLVVSRGDDELLAARDRRGLHFPQTEGGGYAGHHPADSREAIAHLESVRVAQGADFLVFPSTGLWWLDHYAGFREHLERTCEALAHYRETAVIYSLRRSRNGGSEADR